MSRGQSFRNQSQHPLGVATSTSDGSAFSIEGVGVKLKERTPYSRALEDPFLFAQAIEYIIEMYPWLHGIFSLVSRSLNRLNETRLCRTIAPLEKVKEIEAPIQQTLEKSQDDLGDQETSLAVRFSVVL